MGCFANLTTFEETWGGMASLSLLGAEDGKPWSESVSGGRVTECEEGQECSECDEV